MIKHGVVMVTLLILTLSLLGVVSASDDISTSDVGSQLSLNQDYGQIEVSESVESSESIRCDSSDYSYDEGAFESDNPISLDVKTDERVSGYGSFPVSYDGFDGACKSSVLVPTAEMNFSNSINSSVVEYVDIGNDLSDNVYEFSLNVPAGAFDLPDFESADEIIANAVEGTEISNVTAENVLNGIIDASNGYVTYDKGNLLKLSSIESDLIDFAFFIKKDESLTMAFYNNRALAPVDSDNAGLINSDSLWNDLQMLCSDGPYSNIGIVNSWSIGCLKDVLSLEYQKHKSAELISQQDMIQTLLENGLINNDIGLLDNGDNQLLSASKDSDDDAFIWAWNMSPDKNAYVGVDSENKDMANIGDSTSKSRMITVMSYVQSNFKEIMENNLNPDESVMGQTQSVMALTPLDIRQIGINASKRAMAYFKSQGIDVNKDYKNFYVLTSAGYATIEGLSTEDAIDGVIDVFGPKIGKNLLSIDTPLWKDLVFYFLWVSSPYSENIVSYALKYDSATGQLIQSRECRDQGDFIAYALGLYGKPAPKPPVNPQPHRIYPAHVVCENILVDGNLTNKTNSTNKSVVDKPKEVKKPTASRGSPYNILYNLAAIGMIFAVFGASYSKR